eukprot:6896239-Prymnesium_polylepis.1
MRKGWPRGACGWMSQPLRSSRPSMWSRRGGGGARGNSAPQLTHRSYCESELPISTVAAPQ